MIGNEISNVKHVIPEPHEIRKNSIINYGIHVSYFNIQQICRRWNTKDTHMLYYIYLLRLLKSMFDILAFHFREQK
jgi:hypothetical protein